MRPCVFSRANLNYKIEIGAAAHVDYPDEDDARPLLVFRERQLRTYDYMLLMPDNDGYDRLFDLSNQLQSPGRGLPRPITDIATLQRIWPDCPLLQILDMGEQGI